MVLWATDCPTTKNNAKNHAANIRVRWITACLCCWLGSCQGFVLQHRQYPRNIHYMAAFSRTVKSKNHRVASCSGNKQPALWVRRKNNGCLNTDDENEDLDDDDDNNNLLVNLVDQSIQSFSTPTTDSSLLPPPGYVLTWASLLAFTSWQQLGFTIALYAGSKLLVYQLDQDYDDDDDDLDDKEGSGLSNNSLLDVFCFLTSLVLGFILVGPIIPESSASSSLPVDSLVAVSAVLVVGGMFASSRNPKKEEELDGSSSMASSRQLMDLWDRELQQKSNDDED